MHAYVNSLSPATGAILALAVLSVTAAIAAGRRRRWSWMREMEELERVEGVEAASQFRKVRRELAASDFMSGAIRQVYYLITILSALALLMLPLLSLDPGTGRALQLALNGVTFIGALALLAYWQGSDDEREGLLRRQLRLAQERAHARRGLAVRDELTGAYTLDFWLHNLEFRARRLVWRQPQITCIMIDVVGLPALEARRGSGVSDQALIQVALHITRSVRTRDVVATYRGNRFVIALDNCPPDLGRRYAERIATNLDRVSLAGTNRSFGSELRVQWRSASIPREASTPIQLLRVTETILDAEIPNGQVDGRSGRRYHDRRRTVGRAIADPSGFEESPRSIEQGAGQRPGGVTRRSGHREQPPPDFRRQG